MKTSFFTKISFFVLIVVVSLSASAATAVRVDAKKTLGIKDGRYKVLSADSANVDEQVCVKGKVVTIGWFGSEIDPVLALGGHTYEHINEGLQLDASPEYSHGCNYSLSAQAQENRFISDMFSNKCDDGNKTVHMELIMKSDTIIYSSETKISRDGKVVSIPSKCTLQKIDAKP
jgi:hypothetical protein